MTFIANVAYSIGYANQALAELQRYDDAKPPTAPDNLRVLFRARHYVSPLATDMGAAALADARADGRGLARWIIEDVGAGLRELDTAWWSLRGRTGEVPDAASAREHISMGVAYLQRAYDGAAWWVPPGGDSSLPPAQGDASGDSALRSAGGYHSELPLPVLSSDSSSRWASRSASRAASSSA